VWSKAYDSLVGLYFSDTSSDVRNNFVGALGDDTIADRVGKPVDRNDQLAGDIWFYYANRYGEYLDATKQGASGDFLPALLEQSPVSAAGYLALGDYFAESGDIRGAVADYGHVLELEPNRTEVHERLAVAYYRQGARPEAIAQWKLVFATLSATVSSTRVPRAFGTTSDALATTFARVASSRS
jgi:tetratricopeptide (TPR) repeat protein